MFGTSSREQFAGCVKDYLIYLLDCPVTHKKNVLRKKLEKLSEAEEQDVIDELCNTRYLSVLGDFAEIDSNHANKLLHFHQRREYLCEILEQFSDAAKIKLFETVSEKTANYLRLAILQEQIAAYEDKQTGVGGVLRKAGSTIGVSDSARKKEFLQGLVHHFSAKYFGASYVKLADFNNADNRRTLRDVILPGKDTLKTLSWLQNDYLEEIGVADVMKDVPIQSVGLRQLLRRMTIRPASLQDSATLVRDYLHYICCDAPKAGDPSFKKDIGDVLKVPNLGDIVLRELPLCQQYFKNIAGSLRDIHTYELAHKRIKRLREILKLLLPEQRASLMTTLGEEEANYLGLALLRSQNITYCNRLSRLYGAKGAFRAAEAAMGVSQSREKALFLRNIAWHFAYQYNLEGAVNIELFNTCDDSEWQEYLCSTILPKSEAALEVLQFLSKEYLDNIGVTQAIETIKSDEAQMTSLSSELQQSFRGFTVLPSYRPLREEMSLTIEVEVNDQRYVRIKRKLDGKNKGTYDGTYVIKEIYDALPEEQRTKLSAYQQGQVFFLKMFPSGKKMVEGFSEAFVGRFIEKMLEAGFIDVRYKDCFAPASIINLPNEAGPALWQSFALGAKLLYQCLDEELDAKPFLSEACGIVFGTGGYELYLQALPHQNHLGLSLIVMMMVLVANNSVHSGNILVTPGKEFNLFTAIDYGAALRNFLGTKSQKDIFGAPLEAQSVLLDRSGNGALRIDKQYIEHYKTIPGFLEAVVAHANILNKKAFGKNEQFISMITSVTEKIYEQYKNAVIQKEGQEYWSSTARQSLFDYIDSKDSQDLSSNVNEITDDNLKDLLNGSICKMMLLRLEKMASYRAYEYASSEGLIRYKSVDSLQGLGVSAMLTAGYASSGQATAVDAPSLKASLTNG